MNLQTAYKAAIAIAPCDKGTTHSYIEYYNDLFSPIRCQVKSILEIGVKHGGSLLTWRNYFGPDTDICGVDKNLSRMNFDVKKLIPRLWLFQDDAYSTAFVEPMIDRYINTGIGFDLIIDDGSHRMKDLRFFLAYYTLLLNRGGYLICEDIATEADATDLETYFHQVHPYGYVSWIIRYTKKKPNNTLLVVQRG